MTSLSSKMHRNSSHYKIILSVGILLTFLLPREGQAREFRNAYISFQLPDTWECKQEQTEWVCRSQLEGSSREAIIILTAKEVGPTDNIESYRQHLSSVQPLNGRPNATVKSRVIYPPKDLKINDQMWIDGFHENSEVPSFFTRYLGTIKEKIAILVTFSAHRDHYEKYAADFIKTVQSLRVIAAKDFLSGSSDVRNQGTDLFGASPSAQQFGQGGIELLSPEGSDEAQAKKAGGAFSSKTSLAFMLLGLLAVIAGVYILLKGKKK